jgi:protein-L-isoaspartate(D-aspartate) O-methyltransferase
MGDPFFDQQRAQMIEDINAHTAFLRDQLGKNTFEPAVLEALDKVPRHEFVPAELRAYAYCDSPLPIGHDKTISQPFIVALMTDLLALEQTDVVLEIGTGLGYQAAVLAHLCGEVQSIEIVSELAHEAHKRLASHAPENLVTHSGDGSHGLPVYPVYDKIIVTAAADLIPPALINQLRPGGRMVIPTGLPESQKLVLVTKGFSGQITTQEILAVRFSQLEYEDDAASC